MFLGDYWLSLVVGLYGPDGSSRLVLLNTEQATTDDTKSPRTVFHFDPEHRYVEMMFDQGGHRPSPEEDLLAPFYQDASQRILAMKVYGNHHTSIFIMKVEVLLKLAREWGGTDLEWERWRTHIVEVLPGGKSDPWISGSRLLCLCWIGQHDRRAWLDVYDFSPRASAQYTETTTDNDGKFVRRMRLSVEGRRLPWDALEVHFSNGGHDSIAHFMVKGPLSPGIAKS